MRIDSSCHVYSTTAVMAVSALRNMMAMVKGARIEADDVGCRAGLIGGMGSFC
jgi:hypothetical protein